MSVDKRKNKNKKKKYKSAAFRKYGDMTPKDYDDEIKEIKAKAKKKIDAVEKRKSRSISLDIRKGTRKDQPWEVAHKKKQAKKKYDISVS